MKPDLVGTIALGVLVFDGFLAAILQMLYLPTYLGATPFPISAVVAALVNVALVMLARNVSDRLGFVAAPLLAWVIGFLLGMMGGPGNDVVLTWQWPTLLLFALGVLPAAGLLYRYAQQPFPASASL
ncbi:hypothetical protein [Antrihabitans spumae]|jgi:hypothetical protein|uniref:Major facilitator superfamily (MFS) profile domain-containing protein n=1 Tax=Antrihabitans spumae TaxID=3373370 RepID=A0ABW7K5Z5_9NOCA